MKPAICIEMLYPEASPEQKLQRIAKQGFKFVEFWSHKDKDIDALEAAAADCGVRIVNFSGQRAGDLIDASTHAVVLREIEESVAVAHRLGSGILMVLSNELGEQGRVIHNCAQLSAEAKHENLVAGLAALMRKIPADIGVVLEPLNTVVDHPGYYLSDMDEAIRVIREVNHPRLKILCDFYHLALMGEKPLELTRRYARDMGHIHIADYPGRHEPGTGLGPWKEVLKELHDCGYSGFVGFEFSPSADSDAALEAVRRLWTETVGEGLCRD